MNYLPYSEYKNSGIEWLNKIPSHWDIIKGRWLFEIKKRIVGELGFDVLSITQNGIRIKDIESNDGQLSMDYSKYQLVEAGDFAMNHMDLLTGYVDRSSVVGVTSPDYRVFSLKEPDTTNPQYALYLLQNGYLNKIFYPYGQGSSQLGRWRLPTEQFKNFSFPLPPLEEQSQIASFIEYQLSKANILVSEQEKLIELLKIKLNSLVLGSFGQLDTKIFRIRNVIDVIERPVIQEENQTYEPIGLFNRGRGLFHKEKRAKADMGDSDFYWVKEGDLILSGQFAWEGAVALAYKEEENCVVSHRYPVIRGKKGIVLTEYLFALFTTTHGAFLLNESSVGAAGRNRPLNMNLLIKEEIPIPNIQTQEKITELVLQRRNLLQEIEKQRRLVSDRRLALFSAAVTGQIDVRNYQPKEIA